MARKPGACAREEDHRGRPERVVSAGQRRADGAQWRDYDGEDVYGDYAVDPDTGAVTQGQAYLPGVGFWNAAANEPQYVHGDQVGTARLLTGPSAAVRARTVMTAFGEPIQASGTGVPPVGTRYGYAGSWGYEEAECRVIDLNGPEPGGETTWCDPLAELGWLHVGHRYYDPASGRFVQRDPIGIRGGLNTYVYVLNRPLCGVDPQGLYFGWWLGDEETGNFWVDLTGGRHSWFDDHRKVDQVASYFRMAAGACLGIAATPFLSGGVGWTVWAYGAGRGFGLLRTGIPIIDDMGVGFLLGSGVPTAAGKVLGTPAITKRLLTQPLFRKTKPVPWEVFRKHPPPPPVY